MHTYLDEKILIVQADTSVLDGIGFWPSDKLKRLLSLKVVAAVIDCSYLLTANKGVVHWLQEAGDFFSRRISNLYIVGPPTNLARLRDKFDNTQATPWNLVNSLDEVKTIVANSLNPTTANHIDTLHTGNGYENTLTAWHLLVIEKNPSNHFAMQDYHLPAGIAGVICDIRQLEELTSMTVSWIGVISELCHERSIRCIILCDRPNPLHVLQLAAMDVVCEIKATHADIG